MQQPPLLPEETLVRVLRVARFDGLGLLVLGSLFALLAAVAQEAPFAAVGLLAAGAGAIELHGVSLLREGEARGVNWLIASQPFLLLVIWCYGALRLVLFQMPPLPEGMGELAAVGAAQMGLSIEDYFERVNVFIVSLLSFIALCYQGGMTVYYWRRRAPISEALAETDSSPSDETDADSDR